MQLSIIIPALNEASGIALALERAWALKPHEVIVVDGQSGDGTAVMASSTASRVLSCPAGRARQQNLGAQAAAGDVLLFLHADNWLAADGPRQIEAALSDPKVGWGAFRQQIDARGLLFRLLESGNAWRAGWRGMPYGDQGIFIRREFFKRVGGFPDVPIMEDVLLARALRRIVRPVLLPGPLHVSPRRWQKHGVVRQTLRNWTLLTAQRLGVSPERLARYYRPHRKAHVAEPSKPEAVRAES